MWRIITKTLQDPRSKIFQRFHDVLALIILASTILVITETVPGMSEKHLLFFWYADIAVIGFFTIEYMLRIATDERPLRYIFSGMGIIDVVAILPSLLMLVVPQASSAVRLLRILRSVRILRLLRVIRLARFFNAKTYGEQRVKRAGHLLPFINLEIYFFALFIVVTFSGTLVYLFERAIPNTNFTSVPDGMWWAITTVTTVGYGDLVPMTTGGKFVASITMIAGFALLALLLSVVGPALQVLLFGAKVDEEKG